MSPSLKKMLFIVVANLTGLTLVLGAAEFAVRWRAEHSFVAACHSFFSPGAPFSEFGTGDQLAADPDLGYRFNPARPGVNSLGIQGPEISNHKLPGKIRIIVLGDSVSAPRRGFVSILRERLKDRAEVINAAIPGYTTYQERRLLERDLLSRNPDLVILQYCLNDNHRFLHRFDANGQMLFTEEARRALLPQGSGFVSSLSRHSYLVFRVRLALLQLRTRGGDYPWENQPDVAVAWQDESWEMFNEHLAAMQEELRKIGARLAVVMAPYAPQLHKEVLARNPSYVLKPQYKMAEICRRAGVPLLDLYPVFAGRGGSSLFFDSYHFNPAGHQVAADCLFEFLRQDNLM